MACGYVRRIVCFVQCCVAVLHGMAWFSDGKVQSERKAKKMSTFPEVLENILTIDGTLDFHMNMQDVAVASWSAEDDCKV